MKTFCLLFLLFFLATPPVKSQNKAFIAGAFIGFYGIEIKGQIKDMYSPGKISGKGGFSFGFNVKRDFSKKFYGALEMRYIQKGSINTIITYAGSQSWEAIHLGYIEVPLSVGLKIKLKKKQLYFESGLAYARMIISKMMLSPSNYWDCSAKINNFKRNDISWVAALKYPILKNEKLVLGLRYSYSLFTIHSLYKLYNMDYGIELYYLFNRNVK